MKATALLEVLLIIALLCLSYVVWIQGQQLVDLELDFDKLRSAIPPPPKPRAPRTPKPKEPTK